MSLRSFVRILAVSACLASPFFASTPASAQAPGCNLTLSKHYNGSPRPGSTFEYRLLWCDPCKDAVNATIVDELPPGVELVRVDAPTAAVTVEGSRITFRAGEPVSGADLFTVHARVADDVASGTEICNTAVVTDDFAREERSTDCFVVGENLIVPELSQRLTMHGHLKSRPGRQLTYTTWYFRVPPENTLTLTLPPQARLIRVHYPKPASIDGQVITWKNLPTSSGKVRFTYQIDFDLPHGEILEAFAVLEDAIGIEKESHFTTVVRQASAGDDSTDTPPVDFSLSGTSFVRAGGLTTVRTSYRNIPLPAQLVVTLPAGLSVSSTFPDSVVRGNDVVIPLTRSSSTAKLNLVADTGLATGTQLELNARILGPQVDAVSRFTTSVR